MFNQCGKRSRNRFVGPFIALLTSSVSVCTSLVLGLGLWMKSLCFTVLFDGFKESRAGPGVPVPAVVFMDASAALVLMLLS